MDSARWHRSGGSLHLHMDSIEIMLSEENIEEASSEHLLYEDFSQEPEVFGDPPIPPRIGKDYQIDVPPLELESKCLQLSPHFAREPTVMDYRLGNAIPVIWVLDMGITEGDEHNKGIDFKGGERTFITTDLQIKKTDYIPLPGAPGVTWTEAEKESFLLGLYIFGKNLIQLKGFVGSKNMGDILSFYYGAFYRTNQHCRWSDCKKAKSRKCINGQRIFSGWRQNELLTRLSPSLSEESHKSLLEATKRFNESETSLENYVFDLKKIVGMKALVDGIAIGKGKDDLTDTALDPVKGNHSHSIHSEIPVGKACSSLSSSDIVKFLTGDYRLSKARSNDLFWEAVWPRLLAKGWHSEQPKEKGCATLKHPLVFLVPGVRKFSRKKLVRGEHYFDSVSDVLCKIASEPTLLELGAEGASVNFEFALHEDHDLAKNGSSDCQRNCYLRPLFPASTSDFLKFTVVDTTLVQGEPPFKVRELRGLPMDNNFSHLPSGSSAETETGSSKEHQSSSETSLNDQDSVLVPEDKKFDENMEHICEKRQQPESSDNLPVIYRRKRPRTRKDANMMVSDPPSKSKIIRRRKPGKLKILPPVSERGKLNACSYSDRDYSHGYSSERNLLKSETSNELKSCAPDITLVAETETQRNAESTIFDKQSSKVGMETIFGNKCLDFVSMKDVELRDEKPQGRALIDLNLPQFPPDFDVSECASQVSSQDDLNINGRSPSEMEQSQGDHTEVGTSNKGNNKQSSPPRRQSTRNRPLTTRALEALESGFLNTKRERGARSSFSDTYRPSRRARKTATALSNTTIDNGNSVPRVKDFPISGKDDDCTSYSNETTLPNKSYFDGEGKAYGYDFFNIH